MARQHQKFFIKEKAYYDKYHPQADKFIIVPYYARAVDLMIVSGNEEPPADVVAMYYDYASRKESWAYESVKYSIEKIRNHNFKYMGYAIQCREYISFDQRREMKEELNKAWTFNLKIKITYTELYGDGGPGIIISEGEGKISPNMGEVLSGDINIQSTKSGFFEDMVYSPTEYQISAEVRTFDPCETESCYIWVSTLGLEEEELGYDTFDDYYTFSEVLI